MKTKADLRKILKSKLASLTDQEHLNLSIKLSILLKNLLNDHSVIHRHSVIGVFAPIKKEPLWFLKMDEAMEKLTAYPAYSNHQMIFRLAERSKLVMNQDFGTDIWGPDESEKIVTPKIVIVPGLGFSKDGARLGRGKGFYDRYLEDKSVIKIGISFDMQIMDYIPTDLHDVKMDFIVTEQEILKINS